MHVNRAYTYFNHNEVVLRFHGSASAPFSTFVLIFMSALRNFIFFSATYCNQSWSCVSKYVQRLRKKRKYFNKSQLCRNQGGGARGATGPPPQYLADKLTLFQPGRADYPHLLLLAPPMFFTFRHHWKIIKIKEKTNNKNLRSETLKTCVQNHKQAIVQEALLNNAYLCSSFIWISKPDA